MLTPKQADRKSKRIARLALKGRSGEGVEKEYAFIERINAAKAARRKAKKLARQQIAAA